MPGRIKKGEGTLIGNAGEFYVVAELLKRGIVAALAPRNAPAFDILATRGDKTIRIRVKTKSAEYTDWQWMAKVDGETIFRDLHNTGDFTVLVNLTQHIKDMSFFILPTSLLNEWLISGFKKWLSSPGKLKPHDPGNRKRHLKYPEIAQILAKYEDWDILWQ